jgi:DNA repair protein RecO (recombination protein O)
MEFERTEAVALRVAPVTETSLLITWLTRDAGKIKTLAKGARRPKSPLRGKIDLFYEVEIVWWRSRRSDLHGLHDCFLINPHRRLREDVARLAAASYACELVDAVTAVEDRPGLLYPLLTDFLPVVEREARAVPLLWFELRVLAAAGWRPEVSARPGIGRILQALAGANPAAMQRVRLTEAQLREARGWLAEFRREHLGRELRTEKFLAAKIQR